MERIGYVGLGNMGRPMSSNLLRKGFKVTVFDTDEAKYGPVVDLGARRAGSLAELAAESEIVITMLPDSPHVESVVTGAGGLIENGRKGMLLVDTSTIFPAVTDKIARAVSSAGMSFVDAAVGRLPPQAIRGESMFMVGGTEADLERVRPVLEAMGNTIIHCGPVGSGIRCKLVNNFLTMVTAKANAEALTMATKVGLPFDIVWKVLTGTTASNGCLTTGWVPKVFAGDIEPGFGMALARKDLALGIRMADEAGVDTDLADLALTYYDALLDSGYANKDFSAIVKAACDAAGVATPVFSNDNGRP
jgi:4-hydroxybutyrate dehydrogenase/sulfolactaldehyde 3-reductase